MLWTRSELKGRAKFLLKQNYWYSVLAALIYTFLLGNGFTHSYNVLKNKNSEVETSIQGFHPILMFGIAATVAVVVVISFIVYLAIAYFLWNPMTVGCCKFFKNGRDGRQDVKDIFRMVRDCNKTVRMTMLLKTIYLTLWSLLFIVPGVIKGYEYAMVPYLLLDHPEMSRQEIFAESKRMGCVCAGSFLYRLAFAGGMYVWDPDNSLCESLSVLYRGGTVSCAERENVNIDSYYET